MILFSVFAGGVLNGDIFPTIEGVVLTKR